MNLDALVTARVARGFSQSELASRLDVSQAVYSKIESGLAPLSEDRLVAIAGALELPVEYFDVAEDAEDEARVFHRKRASLPVKADRRIRAEASVLQSQLRRLIGSDLPPLDLPAIEPTGDGDVDPVDIAHTIRGRWGLGVSPIGNLVELLEHHGVVVVAHDMQTMRVDAIALWPPAARPMIFLSRSAPPARTRFTLAHELGHLIMHSVPNPVQEQQADEFASAFLMPRDGIIDDLAAPSMASLLRLKGKWGTSMAALARRARDFNQMTERQYKSFSIEMSSTGLRTREPGEPDREMPRLVQAAIERRAAAGETPAHVARAATMTESDFHQRYLKASS